MAQLVKISGNVGNKPELHFTQTGKPVANFSVYQNVPQAQNGGLKQATIRTRVTVWDDLAKLCCDILDKGRRVEVEGVLRPHEWQDRQGNAHSEDELVARRVETIDLAAKAE